MARSAVRIGLLATTFERGRLRRRDLALECPRNPKMNPSGTRTFQEACVSAIQGSFPGCATRGLVKQLEPLGIEGACAGWAAPSPSVMKIARRRTVGAHARHVQGLAQVQVRSARPIPATETSPRCEIFLCFRECATPWECSDMLPARTRTGNWTKVPDRCCGPTPPLRLSASPGSRLACLASAVFRSSPDFGPICVAESPARGLSTQVCPSLDSLSPNRTGSCQSPVQRRQVKAPNGSRSARVGRR